MVESIQQSLRERFTIYVTSEDIRTPEDVPKVIGLPTIDPKTVFAQTCGKGRPDLEMDETYIQYTLENDPTVIIQGTDETGTLAGILVGKLTTYSFEILLLCSSKRDYGTILDTLAESIAIENGKRGVKLVPLKSALEFYKKRGYGWLPGDWRSHLGKPVKPGGTRRRRRHRTRRRNRKNK